MRTSVNDRKFCFLKRPTDIQVHYGYNLAYGYTVYSIHCWISTVCYTATSNNVKCIMYIDRKSKSHEQLPSRTLEDLLKSICVIHLKREHIDKQV